MRLLIFILLLPFVASGQIIRTQSNYRPIMTVGGGCSMLLDTYTGSTAAFSMDKIRTAYAGSCIRVRESGGNTESDIGFVGTCGKLDSASLLSFVGANDGFIVKWYDQSGNSNDAVQATAANQPRIVLSGTIDRNSTGKMSVYFTGAHLFLTIPNIEGAAIMDAYTVQDYSDVQWLQFEGAGAGGNYSYVAVSGSGTTTLYSNFGTPSLYANGSLITPATWGDVYTALNGYKISVYQAADVSSWTRFTIGNYTSWELTGYVGELVIWTTNQSSNRAGILSNQNSRWVVY